MNIYGRILDKDPDFLSDAELIERLELFRSNPHSIEYAAECGLLATKVLPAYGGLLHRDMLGYGRTVSTFGFIRSLSQFMATYITWHESVCRHVYSFGTFTQCDLFLPQLAAGKRIGVAAHFRKRLCATETTEGHYLQGDGQTTPLVMGKDTLVLISTGLGHFGVHFIIPITELLPRREIKQGKLQISLHKYFVPMQWCLNAHTMPEPSTEKWEAIRWRTDRSAS